MRCPGASEKRRHFGYDDRNTPHGRGSFQFALAEEGYPVTVRREERKRGTLGVRNQDRLKVIEPARVQMRESAFRCDVSYPFAVRGNRKRHSDIRGKLLGGR